MAPEDTVYSSCHHQLAHSKANDKTYTKPNTTAYSTTTTPAANRAQNNSASTTNPRKAMDHTDDCSS